MKKDRKVREEEAKALYRKLFGEELPLTGYYAWTGKITSYLWGILLRGCLRGNQLGTKNLRVIEKVIEAFEHLDSIEIQEEIESPLQVVVSGKVARAAVQKFMDEVKDSDLILLDEEDEESATCIEQRPLSDKELNLLTKGLKRMLRDKMAKEKKKHDQAEAEAQIRALVRKHGKEAILDLVKQEPCIPGKSIPW